MRVSKCQSITLHDAQQIALFRNELHLVVELRRDGHTEKCAKFQVFESHPCTCPRRFGKAKGPK